MVAFLQLRTGFKAKLNRGELARSIARTKRRALFRTGNFGRKVERSSILRRKKKASQPGKPPFARQAGGGGIKLIRFDVANDNSNVVIGPVKFTPSNKRRNQNRPFRGKKKRRRKKDPDPFIKGRTRTVSHRGKTVPQILNEGGPMVIEFKGPDGKVTKRTVIMRHRPYRDLAYPLVIEKFKESLSERSN